ncbi:MAG TPA: hypothetical protein VMF08_20420 [Candidatus Sulfotelmatobacter sp.]|nr:hypothetical protein [Candidatus Sulfotelmatobacter sp.]
MKPRIHIIGGPGSGKSYAAAKLAERLGVPACDLDNLFWDGIRADPAERDRKLAATVSADGWIIEGVYYQWLGPSFDADDFIFALTPPIWIRHWRIIRRFWMRKLRRIQSKRESVLDLLRLLRWSHAYDRNHLVRACQFISERGREMTICRTFDELLATEKFNSQRCRN